MQNNNNVYSAFFTQGISPRLTLEFVEYLTTLLSGVIANPDQIPQSLDNHVDLIPGLSRIGVYLGQNGQQIDMNFDEFAPNDNNVIETVNFLLVLLNQEHILLSNQEEQTNNQNQQAPMRINLLASFEYMMREQNFDTSSHGLVRYNQEKPTIPELLQGQYIFGVDLTEKLNNMQNIEYSILQDNQNINNTELYNNYTKGILSKFCTDNNLCDDFNKFSANLDDHRIVHSDHKNYLKINYIVDYCRKLGIDSEKAKNILADIVDGVYNVNDGCQANIGNKITKLALECYMEKNNIQNKESVAIMLGAIYNNIWPLIQNSADLQNGSRNDLLGLNTNGLYKLSAFENASFKLDRLHEFMETGIRKYELLNSLDFYKNLTTTGIHEIDGLLESGELEESKSNTL